LVRIGRSESRTGTRCGLRLTQADKDP